MSSPRAEVIARDLLFQTAGVYYTAANDTQRANAVAQAAQILEPRLAAIEAAALSAQKGQASS